MLLQVFLFDYVSWLPHCDKLLQILSGLLRPTHSPSLPFPWPTPNLHCWLVSPRKDSAFPKCFSKHHQDNSTLFSWLWSPAKPQTDGKYNSPAQRSGRYWVPQHLLCTWLFYGPDHPMNLRVIFWMSSCQWFCWWVYLSFYFWFTRELIRVVIKLDLWCLEHGKEDYEIAIDYLIIQIFKSNLNSFMYCSNCTQSHIFFQVGILYFVLINPLEVIHCTYFHLICILLLLCGIFLQV